MTTVAERSPGRWVPQRGNSPEEEKYQGREITSTIQAPTEEQLDRMISGMRRYAKKEDLGPVDVLQKRQDPDGGWEAIVRSHNWNPIKWIKEKAAPAVAAVKRFQEKREVGQREKKYKEMGEWARDEPYREYQRQRKAHEAEIPPQPSPMKRAMGGIQKIGTFGAKMQRSQLYKPQMGGLYNISMKQGPSLQKRSVGIPGGANMYDLSKLREAQSMGNLGRGLGAGPGGGFGTGGGPSSQFQPSRIQTHSRQNVGRSVSNMGMLGGQRIQQARQAVRRRSGQSKVAQVATGRYQRPSGRKFGGV